MTWLGEMDFYGVKMIEKTQFALKIDRVAPWQFRFETD